MPSCPSCKQEAPKDATSRLESGQVTELAFDLQPASTLFKRGQRIRLTVNCADRNNHQTPELSPPPVVNLHYGESHPCHVVLPVIPRRLAK